MMLMINIKDFGAVEGTDNSDAVQRAMDAAPGERILVPNGRWSLGARGNYRCINPPSNTRLVGESREGAVLEMAGGAGSSVQLIYIEQSNVTIENITLDGNKANQTVDPHRAGVFGRGATRASLRGVTMRNFTGDGFEFVDTDDISIFDVLATDCDRNGGTFTGTCNGVSVVKSKFVANLAQQVDSEAGQVNDVSISGCLFDALGVSNDYVLTMTGVSNMARSRAWSVTNNVVNGPVACVWITDVIYAGNIGINASTKPSVYVYRACDRILVHGNDLSTTGAAAFDAGAMIYVVGTNPGQSPGEVTISENTLCTLQSAYGVTAVCARNIQILDNKIIGAGMRRNGESGIFVRATRVAEPTQYVIAQRNEIRNFGAYGVMLGGNGLAQIQSVRIEDNDFEDDTPVPSMVSAMNLNVDGANAARWVTCCDNRIHGGTTAMVARPPAGAAQPWGDGTRWITP